jgi:two-component system phosphate regulon sensor histidine kinase PhoR
MSTRGIYTLIAIMSLALLGIIALQAYWIRNALRLSEQEFTYSVNDALKRVVQRLEDSEALRVLEDEEVIIRRKDTLKAVNSADKMVWIHESEETITGGPDSQQIGMRTLVLMGDDSALIHSDFPDKAVSKEEHKLVRMDIELTEEPSAKADQLAKRIMKTVFLGGKSPEDRLQRAVLDSLIRAELAGEGIRTAFGFLVSDDHHIILQSDDQQTDNSPFRVRLFQNDLIPSRSYLSVNIPNRPAYLLRQVWGMAVLSFLLTSILLICFGLTIRTIFRQKKLSEMKNDFINNMTHEFKTPLATISLAADALENPAVHADSERLSYYAGIIREEKDRLNQQVERVLDAARSERGESLHTLEPLDLNELLLTAVESFRLPVEARGGGIQTDLLAGQPMVTGNRDRFLAAIRNLLDNANKYSPDPPRIAVESRLAEEGIEFSVSDKGIGIPKADQARIFERFFRLSSGDRHDIKGFGLGLSFVKDVVDEMHGNIKLQSAPGKGSVFSIWLPFSGEV